MVLSTGHLFQIYCVCHFIGTENGLAPGITPASPLFTRFQKDILFLLYLFSLYGVFKVFKVKTAVIYPEAISNKAYSNSFLH